jgi:hypothetical protein
MEAEEIMIHPDQRPSPATSRRGFFARTLGGGLGLGAAETLTPRGRAHAEVALLDPVLSEYERILSQTDRLDILGVPRSWSVVRLGFHPFAPERIAVLPSGKRRRHPIPNGRGARGRIEGRIAEYRAGFAHGPADLPPEKLESCFWVMDLITGHYRVPDFFEDWVVGLAQRESLGSSFLGGRWGLVHQYQGYHGAPVDCPPLDWWLFLFPDGIDWASLDDEPVHALIGHVGRGAFCEEPGPMMAAWCLTSEIMKAVDDAGPVSRMGRVAAARHLNQIAAECLEKQSP